MKKALGASRRSLIGQYFTESILLSVISLAVAVFTVMMLLPEFNFIAQKHLSLSLDLNLIYAGIAIIGLVGIVAGMYPALYLSGFDPIEILKGKVSRRNGENWGRKVLVVTQFTLSIVLIVSVLVVYKQMEFVKNKNLGYNRDNLVYFEREGKLIENSQAFVDELKNTPGIVNAVVSGFMVGGGNSTGGVDWEGKSPQDQIQFWEIRSGRGLVDIMGMELLEGRAFSREFGSDSANVIFNKTAINARGSKTQLARQFVIIPGTKK